MRSQDFRKLVRYCTEKQMSLYDSKKLISFNIMMKNDPNECKIHACDDKVAIDISFFEHDDYHNSKFEIDFLFNKIFNTNENENRN